MNTYSSNRFNPLLTLFSGLALAALVAAPVSAQRGGHGDSGGGRSDSGRDSSRDSGSRSESRGSSHSDSGSRGSSGGSYHSESTGRSSSGGSFRSDSRVRDYGSHRESSYSRPEINRSDS